MKTIGLFALLIVLAVQSIAPLHAQTAGQTYRIDLSGHGDFKDIFAAGLQPKRFDDTLGICVVRHAMITFDLGHSNAITIPVNECYFKVLSDYSLYTIDANTIPLTIEETRKWMLPICRTFGTSDRELDDFLAMVAKGEVTQFGWSAGDDAQSFGAGMHREPQNSGLGTIGARLQSVGRNKTHPVQIAVRVSWERPTWTLANSATKLMPPKGYEQLSMEPVREDPEWLRNDEEPSSFVKALNSPEEIKRMRAEYKAQHGSATASSDPATAPNHKLRLKGLLLVGSILILLGWLWSRRRAA